MFATIQMASEIQGAVFADVAALPPRFTQAVISGTACRYVS
jgi:hypothetical protein